MANLTFVCHLTFIQIIFKLLSMSFLNCNYISLILLFIFTTLIGLKGQDYCSTGSTVFIRQSQLDSFLISFPNCKHVDRIDIDGQNINNISALKHLNTIDILSIIYTNIRSLTGLENLKRSQRVSISQNRLLTGLNEIKNLHFSNLVSISYNDSLINLSGLSGDSLMHIIIVGNKKIKNLTGLESSFCDRLDLYDVNLNSFSGHNLKNLKSLDLININTLDSLFFSNLEKIQIFTSPKIFSLQALNSLSSIKQIGLYFNKNLSACSTELICKKLENPDFSLKVELNSNGCNSVEEVRKKCTTNIEDESVIKQIEVYPQPCVNEIFIREPIESSEYVITNMEGKIIQSGQTFGNIDISNLSKGFYVLQLYLNTKKMVTKPFKIIKM